MSKISFEAISKAKTALKEADVKGPCMVAMTEFQFLHLAAEAGVEKQRALSWFAKNQIDGIVMLKA